MTDQRPRDWPNREASQIVRAAGLTWHVQVMGQGPPLLLLHGTGAATHSWRGLLPLLAQCFTVVAPDLPGHGFTQAPAASRLSLPGMARSIEVLLRTLEIRPAMAAGHSAGAAILARMSLDGLIAPRALVSLNGALLPMQGPMGQLFLPLARVLAGVPMLPSLFVWRARNRDVVQKLLDDTGSTLDAEGVSLYARVVQRPGHAASALGMMARWDLQSLMTDLPRLQIPLLLLTGTGDRTISPKQSETVSRLVPCAQLATMSGLGHLAHEEAPAETAALIRRFAGETGILA